VERVVHSRGEFGGRLPNHPNRYRSGREHNQIASAIAAVSHNLNDEHISVRLD